MWLDPMILEWRAYHGSSSVLDEVAWKRPYELWSHAEHLLMGAKSGLHHVDALLTLRRAVDRRVRHLMLSYNLKRIPLPQLPRGPLEILGYIGVVRPIMLQQLVEMRNRVEHEDESPPDKQSLVAHLEVVWYFLRSTDGLVRHRTLDFTMEPSEFSISEAPYGLDVRLDPAKRWIPEVGYKVNEEDTGLVYVRGEVRGPADSMKRLVRIYFDLK